MADIPLPSVRWQSGDAEDCKSSNAGSIPARTSNRVNIIARIDAILAQRDAMREAAAAPLARAALAALHEAGFPAWLVGSLARGEFRAHSDIDILADADGEARDTIIRLCDRIFAGHPWSLVFKSDLPPHTLAHLEAEAADGPILRRN